MDANERHKILDQRAADLNRWLALAGLFLSLISVLAIAFGALGYLSFSALRQVAERDVKAISVMRTEIAGIRDAAGRELELVRAQVRNTQVNEGLGARTAKLEEEQSDEDDARSWMTIFEDNDYQELLISAGYSTDFIETDEGELGTGETALWPIRLVAGYDYQIMGVCDFSCSDLDLALYESEGGTPGLLLDWDSQPDDVPILNYLPVVSGDFVVEVEMYACDSQSCAWFVQVNRRLLPGIEQLATAAQ